MNKIKKISIYDNYYKLFKWLPKEDKLKVSLAVFEYVFEDIEPKQLNEQGLDVWDNLKRLLDVSKRQSLNVSKRWSEHNTKDDTKNDTTIDTKNNTKNDTKQYTNNISLINNLIINNFFKDRGLLRGKIEEWIAYKKERKDKEYTEIGFKRLLSQIEKNVVQYGEKEVIELIDECIASNYAGIIFERLTKKTKLPNWVEKNIESEIATEEEQEELKKILGELK